jgi:putative endonuclease
MTFKRKKLGAQGEVLAANYLRGQGLEILARNWRWDGGELDIVARDDDTLVFVEVKTFCDDYWESGPAVNITAHKKRKVTQGAQAWLAQRQAPQIKMYCRFDVVAVWQTDAVIEHLPGAFEETR